MAKESKIISRYSIDVSEAVKELDKLDEKVKRFNSIKDELNEPVNIEINVMTRTNEKKWYQFWK